MIRLLSGGYRPEDFDFLRQEFEKIQSDIHNNCLARCKTCINCEYRRSCLDIEELLDFLNKRRWNNG